MQKFYERIHGYDKKVPTHQGLRRYINFDNAASTPPFKKVIDCLYEEAEWYSSVHRGTGYKSQYMTRKYEEAREIIAGFVGADLANDAVVFSKNTTDSINKIAHYLDFLPGEKIIFTQMEHHSNELPWMKSPHICLQLKNEEFDLEQLEQILTQERGKIKLLAVTGASNVSGYTPPIHTLAELAHQAGAKILVDGAQLIPHRPVQVYPRNDPRHIDFLTFSGHKMYAPFGVGVLIGPRLLFKNYPPSQVGGGTVKGIGPGGIIWAEAPEVEEAGSPNVLGVIATAKAALVITEIGWSNLVEHEFDLLAYTLEKMEAIEEVILYHHSLKNRIGVISFNVRGAHHMEVAEYLAAMYGIGVRNGCFCARRYVFSLLNPNSNPSLTIYPHLINGEDYQNKKKPGLVRISFGCYNHRSEVDILIQALECFIKKQPKI